MTMMKTSTLILALLLATLAPLPSRAQQQQQSWQDNGNTQTSAFLNDVDGSVGGVDSNIFTATSSPTTTPFLHYDLPPFDIHLQVVKQDTRLMEFQYLLDDALQQHLEDFFQQKLEDKVVGTSTKVRFELDSKLIWRELAVENSQDTTTTSTATHYEISGTYHSDMAFNYDNNALDNNNSTTSIYVSQTLMNLFLIEAFQGKYYWDLIHQFLQSPTLQDIKDVQITVLEDGFVQYDPTIHGHGGSFDKQQSITPGMLVGIIFATFFCVGLILIWVYLCTMVNKTFLRTNNDNTKQGDVYKNESVTSRSFDEDDDDANTNGSLFSQADEENSLDVLAKSLTSIPLRHPDMIPRRKKRGAPSRQSFLKPARTHISSLEYIQEADNESCASSTVASIRTNKTAKTQRSKRNGRSIGTIDE